MITNIEVILKKGFDLPAAPVKRRKKIYYVENNLGERVKLPFSYRKTPREFFASKGTLMDSLYVHFYQVFNEVMLIDQVRNGIDPVRRAKARYHSSERQIEMWRDKIKKIAEKYNGIDVSYLAFRIRERKMPFGMNDYCGAIDIDCMKPIIDEIFRDGLLVIKERFLEPGETI